MLNRVHESMRKNFKTFQITILWQIYRIFEKSAKKLKLKSLDPKEHNL